MHSSARPEHTLGCSGSGGGAVLGAVAAGLEGCTVGALSWLFCSCACLAAAEALGAPGSSCPGPVAVSCPAWLGCEPGLCGGGGDALPCAATPTGCAATSACWCCGCRGESCSDCACGCDPDCACACARACWCCSMGPLASWLRSLPAPVAWGDPECVEPPPEGDAREEEAPPWCTPGALAVPGLGPGTPPAVLELVDEEGLSLLRGEGGSRSAEPGAAPAGVPPPGSSRDPAPGGARVAALGPSLGPSLALSSSSSSSPAPPAFTCEPQQRAQL